LLAQLGGADFDTTASTVSIGYSTVASVSYNPVNGVPSVENVRRGVEALMCLGITGSCVVTLSTSSSGRRLSQSLDFDVSITFAPDDTLARPTFTNGELKQKLLDTVPGMPDIEFVTNVETADFEVTITGIQTEDGSTDISADLADIEAAIASVATNLGLTVVILLPPSAPPSPPSSPPSAAPFPVVAVAVGVSVGGTVLIILIVAIVVFLNQKTSVPKTPSPGATQLTSPSATSGSAQDRSKTYANLVKDGPKANQGASFV
jgi:hypothetical protein